MAIGKTICTECGVKCESGFYNDMARENEDGYHYVECCECAAAAKQRRRNRR